MDRKPKPDTATFDTYQPKLGDRVVITPAPQFDQSLKGAEAEVIRVASAGSNAFVRLFGEQWADWPGPVGNGTVRVFPGEIAKVG